jgi:hypothetical protein
VLLNNEFLAERAVDTADRIRREAGATPASQVEHVWRLLLSRPPSATEKADALSFFASRAPSVRPPANPEHDALTDLCHALLASNAFLYID